MAILSRGEAELNAGEDMRMIDFGLWVHDAEYLAEHKLMISTVSKNAPQKELV
jgi:hypothetical protein